MGCLFSRTSDNGHDQTDSRTQQTQLERYSDIELAIEVMKTIDHFLAKYFDINNDKRRENEYSNGGDAFKQLKDKNVLNQDTISRLYRMRNARNPLAHEYKVSKLHNRYQFKENFRTVINNLKKASPKAVEQSDSDHVVMILSRAN